MRLSQIGVTGQKVAVLAGGDVGPDGRLLSIAELQVAWRQLIAEQTQASRPKPHLVPHIDPETTPAAIDAADADSAHASAAAPASAAGQQQERSGVDLPAGTVAVLAAHAGAGASTVALVIAAAAGEQRRHAHLVETAAPTRSGLAEAAERELGVDGSGDWRRGRRGLVTIDRRASDRPPQAWPAAPQPAVLAVADLGLPPGGGLRRLQAGGQRVVVVFRATVPGVRLAELTLARLDGLEVVAAAIGPGRWPGEVTTSTGPRLQALRAAGRLVAVPADRHLELTGPTYQPLPKTVRTAGRGLLHQLDQLSTQPRLDLHG